MRGVETGRKRSGKKEVYLEFGRGDTEQVGGDFWEVSHYYWWS